MCIEGKGDDGEGEDQSLEGFVCTAKGLDLILQVMGSY